MSTRTAGEGGDAGGRGSAITGVMAFVVGFAPWIVYWILVGNVPFLTAVLVAFGLALAVNALALVRRQPLMALEVGTAVVFLVFTVMALTLPESFLERWLQPLGNLGLFVIVLVSVLVGKPFTLQYARRSAPRELWDEPGFVYVCVLLAWVWVAAMAAMTVVSAIPPLVDGGATIKDEDDALSIACYWVLPFTFLGLAFIFTSKFPDWFAAAAGGDDTAERPSRPAATPLPVDGAADVPRAGGLVLEAGPVDALVDAVPAVEVGGAGAGERLEMSAETVDGAGVLWRSRTELAADAAGSLRMADASTLVWAMAPAGGDGSPALFIPPAGAAALVVSAHGARGRVHSTLVRRTAAEDVRVTEVREPGIVGRMFSPSGPGPLPAIALFPGSEGGLDSQSASAALLASHGCRALVVATFAGEGEGEGLAGLPPRLERVPLERFADAIRWLAAREDVDAGRVTAMGISRGSEGLLAAAAESPDLPLRRIVAVSPSCLTWEGLGEHGSLPGIPAWTSGGADLAAAATDGRAVLSELAREAIRRRGRGGPAAMHLTRAYAPALERPADPDTVIAVERIAAPLLLVAGEDDQVWPSAEMARRILARRTGQDDELVSYPGAGHLLRLGLWPATGGAVGDIALGGTPEGTARAEVDLTTRVVALATA